MSAPHLVIFEPDARIADALKREIRLPFVTVVNCYGKEATSVARLDAIWLTWMQAEQFGITPQLEPHVAVVFRTPDAKVKEGFAPFTVAGVNFAKNDPPDLIERLRWSLEAVLGAILRFNKTEGAIERIGTLPTTLVLGKLPTPVVADILEKVWGPRASGALNHESGHAAQGRDN